MTEQERPVEVPYLLRAAAAWGWRLLVLLGLLWVVATTARRLELALLPLLTAVLLSALLQPVNLRLRRWRLGRGPAATLTMLLAIAVLGGVGVFVANRAAAGYPQLVDQISRLVTHTQNWLINGPLHLNSDSVHNTGSKLVDYLRSRQGQVVSSAVSAGRVAIDAVTALVLTFFLTIFLLYDGERIFRWLTALVSPASRAKVDEVGERMWHTVSGYVTGTFLVAVFHAVVMGITLAAVGVPLVAPLAVLIFLGSFIPLIGFVVFGGLAVLVTLVSNGLGAAVVVLVVLLIDNQIESHVLQPFVVGRHVRLHPMGIALTLACSALLAGIPGAIFGVPLVASINAAVATLRAPSQEPPPEVPAPPGTPAPPKKTAARPRARKTVGEQA